MIATARAWFATRSDREQRLIGLAIVVTTVAIAASAALAATDDLRALSARVLGHERELVQVRRLARTVTASASEAGGDESLSATLQAAAEAAGLGDRLAAMSPTAGTAEAPARLRLRVNGASLAETIGLLHALGRDPSGPGIAHLGLRKHPDDAQRFEVTLEVTGERGP